MTSRFEQADSRPTATALKFRREPTQEERMKQLIRNERLQMELDKAGQETFEEADDFDIGDDIDPESPYELYFDPNPIEDLPPPPSGDAVEPSAEPTKRSLLDRFRGKQEEAEDRESGPPTEEEVRHANDVLRRAESEPQTPTRGTRE